MYKYIIYLFLSLIILNTSFAKTINKINSRVIQQKADECLTCHFDNESNNNEPAHLFKQDIHFSKGIACAGCHGGDSSKDDMDEAMDKNKGYIGILSKEERYQVCVKCHSDPNKMKSFGSNIPTDQFEKLKGSIHFIKSVNAVTPIADCVTCHSVHNIASVKDPRSKVYPANVPSLCKSCHSNPTFMKQYNPSLPVDQYEKYRTSVHGKQNLKGDAKVAECVSCHGNHDILSVKNSKSPVYPSNVPQLCSTCHSDKNLMDKYKLPHDQYENYKGSIHGEALFVKQDLSAPACNDCHGNHGATPPGVESISNVCGTCHAFNAELFAKSPHKKAFDKLKYPECITCHSNHKIVHATDELLGVAKNSKCVQCHKNEPNDKGFMIAAEMKSLFDSLESADKISLDLLKSASQKGMDVSEADYSLKQIKQILIQARTITHLSDIKEFKDKMDEGFIITNKTKQAGLDAIDEFYFRRYGLGIATIIITFLVVLLYIKTKRIDKKK